MNPFMWLIVIFGGGLGILTSLYLVVSIFAILGYKIYRKVRFGISLYN